MTVAILSWKTVSIDAGPSKRRLSLSNNMVGWRSVAVSLQGKWGGGRRGKITNK